MCFLSIQIIAEEQRFSSLRVCLCVCVYPHKIPGACIALFSDKCINSVLSSVLLPKPKKKDMPEVLNANVVFLPMVCYVLLRTASRESKHCKVAGSETLTMTSASWGEKLLQTFLHILFSNVNSLTMFQNALAAN